MALGFASDRSLREVRRALRNGAGTIPFYDFQALKELFHVIFNDVKVMRTYFEGPVNNDEPSPYGETKIEHPFHVLDCGLCVFLACYVKGNLGYKFYQALEFKKIHDNLQRHLTFTETAGQDTSSLAAFKFRKLDKHSYWVVNCVRGYQHVLHTGYKDKLKANAVVVPAEAIPEPSYDAESPPIVRKKLNTPSAPKKSKPVSRVLDFSAAEGDEPSAEEGITARGEHGLPEPTLVVSSVTEPTPKAGTAQGRSRTTKVVPLRDVLFDSDDE